MNEFHVANGLDLHISMGNINTTAHRPDHTTAT